MLLSDEEDFQINKVKIRKKEDTSHSWYVIEAEVIENARLPCKTLLKVYFGEGVAIMLNASNTPLFSESSLELAERFINSLDTYSDH